MCFILKKCIGLGPNTHVEVLDLTGGLGVGCAELFVWFAVISTDVCRETGTTGSEYVSS